MCVIQPYVKVRTTDIVACGLPATAFHVRRQLNMYPHVTNKVTLEPTHTHTHHRHMHTEREREREREEQLLSDLIKPYIFTNIDCFLCGTVCLQNIAPMLL